MDEQEEWRPVVGWQGLYEVSSLGRVRSLDRDIILSSKKGTRYTKRSFGRILCPKLDTRGYFCVNLSGAGTKWYIDVHRLVCEAYHGPRPDGHEVAHNDGVKINNTAINLRWATHLDNVRDTAKHGRKTAGVRHPQARLTVKDVAEIRRSDLPARRLAKAYDVTESHINSLKSGRRRNIPGYP